MADSFSQLNPLYGIYSDFQKLLKSVVIKYSYLAEKYETFEIKKAADMYIAAKDGLDTFFTYRDYTSDELYAVGITDVSKIALYSNYDGYLQIPTNYREPLLKNRRAKIIETYEEQNEYYRTLNGYPPLDTPARKYHYVPQEYTNLYNIEENIPIHKIQDYYNNKDGSGNYLISVIEGTGLLDTLKKNYPDEEYLNYIGSTRIDLSTMRKAKNFQLLYIKQTSVSDILYEEFIKAYEQARDYHVSAIFIREYRNIMPYYDQFIALCIMFMAIQLTINKQFKLGIDRKYYNDYAIKLLYDSYGVPYNLNLDEYTQRSISQSLNTLIQKKSTDNVFYDITKILGFTDLKIYRYYLTKERRFDAYGVPVIAKTTKFNNDTGEFEEVPDYAKMYDIYFQKVELSDTDFISAYDTTANKELYETITENDPFWWDDENTIKSVYETDYNFVEAKYLSLGLSYKMTEVMYENILLLKLLADAKDELSSIDVSLPKIDESLTVRLFDAIILLFCLMAKKHNLRGEIISIPSQVLSVLDDLSHINGERDGEALSEYLRDTDSYLYDVFGFNISLFQMNDADDGQFNISNMQVLVSQIYDILDKVDADRFMSYISELQVKRTTSDDDKIEIINRIFNNVKGLSKYLQYLMTKTNDRKTYELLKEFYYTAFYSKEARSMFEINKDNDEITRTAKDYFEFLYHYNPALYSSLFASNFEGQYADYITSNNLNTAEYTLDKFIDDVNYGYIDDFTYSTLKETNGDENYTNDLIYFYIDHIISRIELIIPNLKYIYMMNDTATPLEDLLIKLVNFFKSFTVDMLGLESMYIMDLRAENTMKIFDEIHGIIKEIEVEDNFKFSYKDMLYLSETILRDINNHMSFNDKVVYNAYISIIKNSKDEYYNHSILTDHMNHLAADIIPVLDPTMNRVLFSKDYIHDVSGSISGLNTHFSLFEKYILDIMIMLAKNLDGEYFNKIDIDDNIKDIMVSITTVIDPNNNRLKFSQDLIDDIEGHVSGLNTEFSLFEKYMMDLLTILSKDSNGKFFNVINLNDVMKYITSNITPVINPDTNKLLLSKDFVTMISKYLYGLNSSMLFNDTASIGVTTDIFKDNNGNILNDVFMNDNIHTNTKNIDTVSEPTNNIVQFIDSAHVQLSVNMDDKATHQYRFTDKVVSQYYSD